MSSYYKMEFDKLSESVNNNYEIISNLLNVQNDEDDNLFAVARQERIRQSKKMYMYVV